MKGLCHRGQPEDGNGEPHHVAQRNAGRKGDRSVHAAAEHACDDGRDAGARRSSGDEESAGEEGEGGWIHRSRVLVSS